MTPKKVVGISLILGAIGYGLYYAWNKTQEVGLLEKSTRSVSFETSYCLSGLLGMSISLPAIESAFYSTGEIEQIRAKISQIRTQYGLLISNIAMATNVAESIIYSFIFIESAGNQNVISGSNYGLMQVGTNSATDTIYSEWKKGRLGATEQAILRRWIGTRLDNIFAMKSLGMGLYIYSSDLINPELNILIGTINLGQLMDESIKQDGALRMDKVIVRYNMGYYAYNRGKSLPATVQDTVNMVNSTTSNYIVKLIGKNGVLEILEAEHCS